MKRYVKILIIATIIILVVLAGVWAYKTFSPKPKYAGPSGPSVPPVKITYVNLPQEMGKLSIVWSIPKDGVIALQFYNFNTGTRQIEKSYILTPGNVKEGSSAADITISIHSKYMSELTNQNLCTIIAKAKQTGDLGIESSLSGVALAWKYKSMYEYRDCLGF
ncbi:MAG: hypothetical protein WCK90_01510 [archaeon]